MKKNVIAVFVFGILLAQGSVQAKGSVDNHDYNGHEKPADVHDDHDDHGHDKPADEHDDHDDHGHEKPADVHDDHDDHDHEKPADVHDDHDDHGHEKQPANEHDDHGHEEEAASALLNAQQMSLASISTALLQAQYVNYQLYAPGEVTSNGYTSYSVSPRVASVVLKRHITLGEHVKAGQSLATLFSEAVTEAQIAFRTAIPEWNRVKKLGRQTIGEQRYLDAKGKAESARARLVAYGLSDNDIEKLLDKPVHQFGEYTLKAQIDGAVLTDNFQQGQRIEAGETLISLADEKQLWVEAHLPVNQVLTLSKGDKAEVVSGQVREDAVVSQESHIIDPLTRTRTVRLLVNNFMHRLHPGMFADVLFSFKTNKPVLAVPETALMRNADGNWTIFVEEHSGEYKPVEVVLGRSLGQLREISGIDEGVVVVVEGAFFVASEIAKGGFDPHNH